MKEINQVPNNAPQEAPAPFEVIIRTTDPKYLGNGGEPECSVKGVGYFIAVDQGSQSNLQMHGQNNLSAIVSSLVKNFGVEKVFSALMRAEPKNK